MVRLKINNNFHITINLENEGGNSRTKQKVSEGSQSSTGANGELASKGSSKESDEDYPDA